MTQASPASLAAPAPRAERRGLAVLLIASTGCAMTVLDTNVVAIVLPTIARDLHAGFAAVEWVISAYVLAFASSLLMAGTIADRFGRRTVFLAGIGLFAVASVACGAAPSTAVLCSARVAQGIGAAFLLAPALAIIGHTFHQDAERAWAWAIWGGMMGLTMVLSPLLGGIITHTLGWRWAFYINVPICGLLAAAVVGRIVESRDADARRLDPLGIVLFAGTIFGLTWGLITGQAHGWLSPTALAGFLGGFLSAALFLWAERIAARPMLDLGLFRFPRFIGAILAMFAYAASAQVMASLLPLYLQNGMGRPPLAAGVAMLPFAGAMLVTPQIGRRLGRRFASHHLLAFGLAVVSLGNLLTAWAAWNGGEETLAAGMMVLGCGGGLLNGETQKAIMGTVPRERAGMASGLSTTSRFTGILLGFAVLGTVLAEAARSNLGDVFDRDRGVAARFADLVVAGDLPGALALVPAERQAAAGAIAHHGYAVGFSIALLAAAAIAAVSALLVARLMRPRDIPPSSFGLPKPKRPPDGCLSLPLC